MIIRPTVALVYLLLLLFAPAAHAQIILGNAADLDEVNADFAVPFGASGVSPTEVQRSVLTSPLGNVVVACAQPSLDPAAGAGVQSWTVTWRLDGVDTAHSILLSEGSTAAVCDTDVVAIGTAGQDYTVQITPANTPAGGGAGVATIALMTRFVPTTPGDTWLGISSVGTTMDDTTTEYLAPHARGSPTATEIQQALVIPTAGTLLNFYGEFDGAAGTGNTYAVDARLCTDANPPVCSDTAVDFSVAGASEVADNSGADTAAVVAGQQVSVQINPDSTPTARRFRGGMTYRTTVPGEFILGTVTSDALNAAATEYTSPHSGSVSWNGTEASVSRPSWFFTATALYARLSAAPGAGTSYTLAFRDDAADVTGLPVAISETNVSGSATGVAYQGIGLSSLLAFSSAPGGTPTTPTASISVLCLDPNRILMSQ